MSLFDLIISVAKSIWSFFTRRPKIFIYFDKNQDTTWKSAMACKVWLASRSSQEHNICSFNASIKEHPDFIVKVQYLDQKYQIPFLVDSQRAEMPFEFLIKFCNDMPKDQAEITLIISVFSRWKRVDYKTGCAKLILKVK